MTAMPVPRLTPVLQVLRRSPPNCDDANVCTDDSCDPATGCVNANNTSFLR